MLPHLPALALLSALALFGVDQAVANVPDAATGQDATNGPVLEEASRLRDSQQFTAAITLLRRHLGDHADDTRAARMLAETLYWVGDIAAARAVYEEAERRHPSDAMLRLEHARMLVQLNAQRQARTRLLTLRDTEETAADAEALLGKLAYWGGDLSAARSHFQRVLQHRPDHRDAARGLADIREATVPWLQTGMRSYDDDQPVARLSMFGVAGAYVTPLHSVSVEAELDRSTTDIVRSGSAVTGVLRSYWPALRLRTEVGGGVRRGEPLPSPEAVGRVSVGVRLSPQLTATLAVEREPYLRTFASYLEPVTVDSARARLDWDTRGGWLGQIAYSGQRYPDENEGSSASAWILAPLSRGERAQLRAGYAFVWEDTRESRYEPLPDSTPEEQPRNPSSRAPRVLPNGRIRPGPRRPSTTDVVGYYAPYYTPIGVRAHSVAAAVAVQPTSHLTVRFNGSYGVHAREERPFLSYSSGSGGTLTLQSGFYTRRYHPLMARGVTEATVGHGVSLQVEVEHQRTAFWRGTQISAGLRYRFLPRRTVP